MLSRTVLAMATVLCFGSAAAASAAVSQNDPSPSPGLNAGIVPPPLPLAAPRGQPAQRVAQGRFNTPGCSPGGGGNCKHWSSCIESARSKFRSACKSGPIRSKSKYDLCESWRQSFNAEVKNYNGRCARR
jgi:hypothetical protein